MTYTEKKAREMISNLTLPELIDEWELTSNINTAEIHIVRGWLMDELEKRNPAAFDKWLDSENCLDTELKYYMMKGN
jgi:hypothetical protein